MKWCFVPIMLTKIMTHKNIKSFRFKPCHILKYDYIIVHWQHIFSGLCYTFNNVKYGFIENLTC